MNIRLHLLPYLCLFLLVLTTTLNDYFALYSILGGLVILYSLFPMRPKYIVLIILVLTLVSSYIVIVLDLNSVIFFVNHLSYGLLSIYGFFVISRAAPEINTKLAKILVIMNIIFCFLQLTGVVITDHYPRLSGIYPNPNQFAVFCLFYLILVQRNRVMMLVLSFVSRSSTFIPIIVVEFFRNRTFLLLVLVFSVSILLVNTKLLEIGDILLTKYWSFFSALTNLSDFSLIEAKDGNEYSAYKRVFHILSTINDVMTFDSYLTFRPFQFREGFLLSVMSVNQILGFILIGYAIFVVQRFLRKRQFSLIFAVLAWLFILPVFDPLIICLMITKRS